METELGRLGLTIGGLDWFVNCPLDGTRLPVLVGGQHLEASQAGSVRGPLGQASMQSSVEVMDPLAVCSEVSTNSGWIVVEWIPSLWKNSLTFSATYNLCIVKLHPRHRRRYKLRMSRNLA